MLTVQTGQPNVHVAFDPVVKQITQAALNEAGVRNTARVLGTSQNTVQCSVKKSNEFLTYR